MALTLVTSDLIGGLDYSKLTGTVPTWNQNTTGSAATLTTARNIGGVSFNGSAAINLPGVNAAGNQNTSGNAGTVTNGVYTVGNQTIGGVKTFSSNTTFSGSVGIGSTGIFAGTNAILNLQGIGIALKNDKNGSNNNWSYIQNDGTGNESTIILSTGNAVPAMKLAHNGDVSIGTTSPEELLDVYTEGTDPTSILQIRANRTGYGNIRTNLKTYAGGSSATDKFTINFEGTDALTISSGGVSTFQLSALTNPSGVDANTGVIVKNNGWSGITLLSSAATGSFLTFGDADAGFRGRILYLHGSTDAMVFETAASEKLRISSGGDLSTSDGTFTMHDGGGSPLAFKGKSTNGGSEIDWYANNGTTRIGYFEIAQTAASKLNIETANDLEIYTNSTKRLTISSGGNMTLASGLSLFTQGTGRVYTHNVTLREQDNTAKFQIYSSGGGCVFYNAESNGAYYFYTNGTERMRITSGGDFHVGTTSNHGFHTINKSVAAGGLVFGISSPATGYWTALFGAVDQGSSNSAQTALFLRKRSSTGRSINAAGTINAGGNDYAEYMTKAVTDTIEKGDIVGINSSGLLTNVFSESISFVIKSTDPSYVGGDSWGNDLNETDLEIERAKVDRIAFSGQVPCNVTGASVGDYIIPVSSSDGKITGQAVSNPTFEQYKISVGKVWKIMNNGNSWVAVKIG